MFQSVAMVGLYMSQHIPLGRHEAAQGDCLELEACDGLRRLIFSSGLLRFYVTGEHGKQNRTGIGGGERDVSILCIDICVHRNICAYIQETYGTISTTGLCTLTHELKCRT